MSTTTVPVIITPEAAARVAELGMKAELERMLEHTRQTVSGLRSIEVQLALPYDTGDETSIIIEASMDDPHLEYDPTDTECGKWEVRTFSPDVCRYFVMMTCTGQPMRGRAFLDVARSLVIGPSEAYWRAAIVHAYYALMLECRDAQIGWGFPIPPHQNVHAIVRLRFSTAADLDLKDLGKALDWLVQSRNRASYNLGPSPAFASLAEANKAVQRATAALALLDSRARRPASTP